MDGTNEDGLMNHLLLPHRSTWQFLWELHIAGQVTWHGSQAAASLEDVCLAKFIFLKQGLLLQVV